MADTPEVCVGGTFVIKADGTWIHDGAPIPRPALVRLFASVLQRDDAGAYWLVTPVERVPVEVEDAPFVAVELAREGTGDTTVLRMRTNIDRWVTLDAAHPLIVRGDPDSPRPYVALGDGLEALVARSVYYELADLAEPGPDGTPGVRSDGAFFALMPEGSAS